MTTMTQLERTTQLAVGLAKSWDSPMTERRREKLVMHVDGAMDRLGCYSSDGKLADWDSKLDGYHVSSIIDDYLWDNRLLMERKGQTVGELGNRVACCVRAAIDLIVAPSAGVIGFTVGDFRRAFGGEIPTEIADSFTPPITRDVADDTPVWA